MFELTNEECNGRRSQNGFTLQTYMEITSIKIEFINLANGLGGASIRGLISAPFKSFVSVINNPNKITSIRGYCFSVPQHFDHWSFVMEESEKRVKLSICAQEKCCQVSHRSGNLYILSAV